MTINISDGTVSGERINRLNVRRAWAVLRRRSRHRTVPLMIFLPNLVHAVCDSRAITQQNVTATRPDNPVARLTDREPGLTNKYAKSYYYAVVVTVEFD